MPVKFSNNASTTLNGAITSSATSIVVADTSKFPVLGAGDYAYLTLSNPLGTAIEVIKVTAINTVTDTITAIRGQDDTTGTIFSSGDICELRLNAAMLNDAASQNDDALGTAVAMSIALG